MHIGILNIGDTSNLIVVLLLPKYFEKFTTHAIWDLLTFNGYM